MSDSSDDADKKATDTADSSQDSSGGSSAQKDDQQSKPVAPVKRPTIGTPVGRPKIGTPIGAPASPAVSAPVATPTPSTLGTPAATSAARPSIGTPVGTRPSVGTPVGARPSVGTPVGSSPRPATAVGTPAASAVVNRPTISSPTAGRPTTPAKKVESKEEISRRNFMKGLVTLGGIVAVAQFGGLLPFVQSTVTGTSGPTTQAILDSVTSLPITTSSFNASTEWLTFVYPRTGNSNLDNDTFKQCVVIKLPVGFTAPSDLSVTDSTGTYVGFSRVCVHLWCLWSYIPADKRMECPCHGSQYVPGSGQYPALSQADNQPPGLAVEGPASLQVAPNNQLPMITLKINSDGSFSATGIVGQIGCGQKC